MWLQLMIHLLIPSTWLELNIFLFSPSFLVSAVLLSLHLSACIYFIFHVYVKRISREVVLKVF